MYINSVSSDQAVYSAVLPPSLTVFFKLPPPPPILFFTKMKTGQLGFSRSATLVGYKLFSGFDTENEEGQLEKTRNSTKQDLYVFGKLVKKV